jgi:hypothetical protein
VDCGGTCGANCDIGETCNGDSDCASTWCNGTQCDTPTCNDGIQNQGEEQVDCGGPNCAACPTCNDNIQNQGETDTDCGGPVCLNTCLQDETCAIDGDCVSDWCELDGATLVCSGCTDNRHNQDEGDTDCGGVCSQKCADGDTCNVGSDCSSGSCEGTCVSCDDNIQNQGESGVDCGGPCPPCGLGCDGGNSTVLPQNTEADLIADTCYSFDKVSGTLQLGNWSGTDTGFDIEDSGGTGFSESVPTGGWTTVSGVANGVGYFKITVSVRAKWDAW